MGYLKVERKGKRKKEEREMRALALVIWVWPLAERVGSTVRSAENLAGY